MQLELFNVSICRECGLFQPTPCNYGWCKKMKIGSIDRSVYENSSYCEMDRRLYNNNLLNKSLCGEITSSKMHELWKR